MPEQSLEDQSGNNALIDYRNHLIKVMEGNVDRFEKQLAYISAGALGVSMAFIKDVVGSLKAASSTGWLLSGWIAMGMTLLLNLVSQAYANYCHSETISEIDANRYNSNLATTRRQRIEWMNYISIASLILGLGFLLYFIHLNLK